MKEPLERINFTKESKTIHYLRTVDPLLIPFTAVARIENYVATAVVQARFVSTDFARLAEHPVLQNKQPLLISSEF